METHQTSFLLINTCEIPDIHSQNSARRNGCSAYQMHAYDHTGWVGNHCKVYGLIKSCAVWERHAGVVRKRNHAHPYISSIKWMSPKTHHMCRCSSLSSLIAVYPLKWSWSPWLGPLPLLLLVSTDTIYNSLAPSEAWLAQDGQDIALHCEFDLGFNKVRSKFTLRTILTCGYPYWVRRVTAVPKGVI